MAVNNICGALNAGLDMTCIDTLVRKYVQQIVLFNRNQVDPTKTVKPVVTDEACDYRLQFELKSLQKGFRFSMNDAATSIKGTFDKSVDQYGNPTYKHSVTIAIMGVSEATKCILRAMDKSSLIAALQIGDEIEIFGFDNGLVSADYTWDIAEGGGAVLITLSSSDENLEASIPYLYKSVTPGGEIADFDADFENLV